MSPPNNDRSSAQSSIYDLLKRKMRGGQTRQKTVIDTEDGNNRHRGR